MTIKELINKAKKVLIENKIEDANILARRLLEHILNQNKQYLIINQDNQVTKDHEEKYINMLQEIVNGKPIQYITNNQEFMKLNFYVDENVLIPQPDTEILVEEVIEIYNKKEEENVKILDICTGSGAIGISVANYCKNAKIVETDISKKALEIAQLNCKRNNLEDKIKFIQSDMFENIKEKFDIIVSNPPYIKTQVIKQLDKQVQEEPFIALDGGEDGLKFYKVLIDYSHKFLNENGYLCIEIGYDQKEEVISLIEKSSKYKEIYSKKDLSGNDRIIICKRR